MADVIPFPWEPEVQDAKDFTPFVERVERLEDLCGVQIGAISAHLDCVHDGVHLVKILAEVTSFAGIGHVPDATIVVQAAAYDADKRMVAQASEYLWDHSYRGLQAIEMRLRCIAEPVRFVIYPRK